MKRAILLVLVVLLFPVFMAGWSMATDNPLSNNQVKWYMANFPPVTIPEGRQVNEGFFDKAMLFLIEGLPEYQHQYHTANFKRIILELEKQENACCPSLYKTPERERFIAFSVPAMVVLPNGVIASSATREKLAPYVDSEGRISLLALLEDDGITLGISNGRIYSGGIDKILKRFEGHDNLLVRSGDDVFQGLLSMMHRGRIDCLLGYPSEAGYFTRENSEVQDFDYYPVKESTVSFTLGHIGCPDTEWGRAVITKINEIVMQHRSSEFIDFYGEWLDESTREIHRQMAMDYFDSLTH